MSNAQQVELANPPTDAISAIQFAPTSLRLLVASWDKYVYLYDTTEPGGRLLNKYEHRAPVLDVCFGENEDVAYTAGVDWDVRRIDLSTGAQTVLSSHTAGVKAVLYSKDHNILISASWDTTLHIHHLHPRSPTPTPTHITTLSLPSKPFSLSASPTKLVIAMSARTIWIYELASLASPPPPSSTATTTTTTTPTTTTTTTTPSPTEPWQRRESPLKFMTRAVACMPTDAGYASSSIEGRVAVEWFDPSSESQARKYAFKCHRQPAPHNATTDAVPGREGGGSGGKGEAANAHANGSAAGQHQPVDHVYPVNTLAFHPQHGTFASGGGDGVVALWDGVSKRRIRQYQKYKSSVAALAFSADGRFLAVGVCPGFEDGREGGVEGGEGVGVFVRRLGEEEARGKGGK